MTPPDGTVTPTEGRGLTSIAFDLLRSDVLRGVLKPQDRLRVQALSKRYDIGATAIREALSRLVTEGLVLVEDQRGFMVAPVSRGDLLDLTEARVEIESLTLMRSIDRGDTAWEADLLGSYHRLSKCPPPVSPEAAVVWSGVHRTFHETLLAGCGSDWLRRICSLLYDKSERYRYLANIRTPPQMNDRVDEHGVLMDAVLKRDARGACSLLEGHYRRTTDIILSADNSAELFQPPRRTRAPSRASA